MRRFCCGLLLLAQTVPTLAQPAAPSRPVEAADTRAVALANIVMPAETFLHVQLQSARAGYLTFAAASPDFRRMEKDFPGATEYVWKAVAAEWRRLSPESHRSIVTDMAATYADLLDPAEIAAATTFYQSPTGQKALTTLYGDADYAAAAQAVARAGKVTAEAQAAAYLDSARQVAGNATAADREALLAFQRAVPAEKLSRVFQTLQTLVRNRANAPNAARDARLSATSYEASKRWVEQARAKRQPVGAKVQSRS